MNAVVKQESSTLPALQMNEAELIDVLATSLYPNAQVSSIKMVLGYCKAAGLDPMQKPVHIVPMYDGKAKMMRDVIMPGIGLYRTQAARNGCAGVSEPEFGPDVTDTLGGQTITYPAWCKVTVKRRLATGELVDFTAKEIWKENYAVRGGQEKSIAPNAMWTKRPYGQIAKCAEAQALRKAFPEIGSEPTADEMEGKSINDYATTIDAATGEIIKAADRTALPLYSDEDFQKNLPAWRGLIESGKKTADQIIAMVSSKGVLSADHMAMIKATKVGEEG
jgi:phage recombination protein Bet